MTEAPHDSNWVDADHSRASDDAWHSHAGEAPPQHAHGQTSPAAIAIFGFGSFVALLITLAVLTVFFNRVNQSFQVEKIERVDLRGTDIVERRAGWNAELNGYGWAGPDRVAIPIDQAIQATIREYRTNR